MNKIEAAKAYLYYKDKAKQYKQMSIDATHFDEITANEYWQQYQGYQILAEAKFRRMKKQQMQELLGKKAVLEFEIRHTVKPITTIRITAEALMYNLRKAIFNFFQH
jgi:hypothetical protein